MIPEKPPARIDSGCWSRNLRGLNYLDSDSDSDFESLTPNLDFGLGRSENTSSDQAHSISEDARLIKELDLSARHDEAVFKANPWSIAKVNAAARVQPTAVTAPKSPKALSSSSARKQPTGQIVNAFKKQSLRSKDNPAGTCIRPATPPKHNHSRADRGSFSRKDKMAEKAKFPAFMDQRLPNLKHSSGSTLAPTEIAFSPAYMLSKSAVTSSGRLSAIESATQHCKASDYPGSLESLQSVAPISVKYNTSPGMSVAKDASGGWSSTQNLAVPNNSIHERGSGSSHRCPYMRFICSLLGLTSVQ